MIAWSWELQTVVFCCPDKRSACAPIGPTIGSAAKKRSPEAALYFLRQVTANGEAMISAWN
mgnify:CR=1 FL=1